MADLFDTLALGGVVPLKNRVVMAPMTRTRTSEGDVPNAMMAAYYAQQAGAGLIVAEATDVAPSSKGYAWTPGIHTDAQRRGLAAGDRRGPSPGRHDLPADVARRPDGAPPSMMPDGEALGRDRAAGPGLRRVRPRCGRQAGLHARGVPRRLETAEISALVDTFAEAFAHARQAGFDGVELHAANGYLFDQFMNSVLNTRTDRYGGGRVEDRARFLAGEVVEAAVRAFGPGRVGVRLGAVGLFNSMPADPLTEETLLYVAERLGRRGVAYLHLVYELMPTANMETAQFQKHHVDPRVPGQGPRRCSPA